LYKKASDGDESATKQVSAEYFWLWEKDYPERPSVQDCWDSGNPKSYYNSDGVLWTSDKWVSSYQAQLLLFKEGYRPYIPFKGRTSVFFSNQWLMADLYGSEYGTNQQSVKGFGMPKFRMQYAKYLKDAGRDDDYENFNVNIDKEFFISPVEPVIFYNHQSVGKYDIAPYGKQVGDVWFPTEGNIARGTDGDGNENPDRDPVFDEPMDPPTILPITKDLHVKNCKDAPNDPDHDCDQFAFQGFGNANFSFPKMDYNYQENRIIPSYNTTADFHDECKSKKHGEDESPSSMCDENESGYKFNVVSRMLQSEALAHAQTAYFVAIVIVQWADLMICKTRMNSISQQGMLNGFMNFGLIFETLLACLICYIPIINIGVQTRPIRATHWLPAVPFSLWIFGYDETRKWIMRTTTDTKKNELTGQIERDAGWMERNTYY